MDDHIPPSDGFHPKDCEETDMPPLNDGSDVWRKQITNGGTVLLSTKNGTGDVDAQKATMTKYAGDDSEKEDLKCGLGPCTPKWIQIFASKQAFLVTFCITWVLQGMYYTYFVSVITTIEKLFRLQSKTTGMIMSATEIGQIGSSLLLTYYGGQGHRPKWIAWGMVLFAVSSFICSLPHFIFGKQLLQANDMLYTGVSSTDNSSANIQPNICHIPDLASSTISGLANDSNIMSDNCGEEFLNGQKAHTEITKIVLAIFFISLLGVGMGQTAVYTLGIPYIDDNIASRESPLYFAITIGVRILGPALGFILGSLCTRLYADLSVSPQITPTDPRWVGAWWLGLVLVSAMLMLASSAMFMFPKRLKTHRPIAPTKKTRRENCRKNPSLRDFPKAVKRLLRNDILMFRTASSVLHLLPIAGLYTFLPKYLESQFRLAAHAANMVSGIGGILVMGLGIIISGVFILRVKPNARFVAAWIAFTAVVYAFGMGILMFIGCPMDDIAGLRHIDGLPKFEPVCQTSCECDLTKFSPICGDDGQTYFSACHAGCQNLTTENGKAVEFSGCLCVQPDGIASIGYCESDCSSFVWYIMLFSLFVFIHSTSEVGSMLLILRCVDPRDKAMALGLIQFAIGLFGNVPCPIIYGAVVDSACLIWETACGKQGACWLYDTKIFRMYYHGITGAILLCAFLVDIIVWYKASSINFVDEQTTGQEEELNPMTGKDDETVSSKSQITYVAESSA
ncbi:solute carrier organic anion transporter family member 74D-like [Lycorma delicatula]|uniref:solute carrier organic anion transporter family member 74D-like n=1 Tax=Lycorma delicatula TaxID=130591 RepID=UPI003F50E482